MDMPHASRRAASFCALTPKYTAVCAGAGAFIVGWMLWLVVERKSLGVRYLMQRHERGLL